MASLEAEGRFFGPFINPDDIRRALGPDGSDLQAGRYALYESRRFIDARTTFARETTLTSREILRTMRAAKSACFLIRMFFVGASSVVTSGQRVRQRAASGGHDIPVDVQMRRFDKSFTNAVPAASMADEAVFYENIDHHRMIARYEHAEPAFLADPLPAWFLPLREALATGG
ncbi:hypothetical protein NOG11_12285 [Parvularcula sp. BGMRC 0090]|uniref:Uncharacterized protein n=1 Tax=Parvularcula maris TaxID=2965077 RepID=A0A9X2LAZ9_9PROT|nr:hypothetical protein [Parvularcula maris]